MNKLDLSLPQSSFDQLHEVSDGRKSVVRVNRADLALLLMDHSRALAALKDHGVTLNEPSKRDRPRLSS